MDFAHYWQYTDAVSKGLFFALFVLSLASWIVGIYKIVAVKKANKHIDGDLTSFINQQAPQLSNAPFEQKKTALEQLLLQKIAQVRFDGEKGIAVLGTTAAIAPFIGLFGTVWGIFHALHGIAQSGQAGLAQVAGPVGEALIMTALGLFVAIPAVIFYNIVLGINKKTMHTANTLAHKILANSAL